MGAVQFWGLPVSAGNSASAPQTLARASNNLRLVMESFPRHQPQKNHINSRYSVMKKHLSVFLATMPNLFWVINATNREERTGFRKTQETMKGLPEVHLHNL